MNLMIQEQIGLLIKFIDSVKCLHVALFTRILALNKVSLNFKDVLEAIDYGMVSTCIKMGGRYKRAHKETHKMSFLLQELTSTEVFFLLPNMID